MRQMKQFLTVGLFCGLIVTSSATWSATTGPEKVFYRYINSAGVKVVVQTIPPEVVKNGYEVVSINGDVIRVVPPAPKGEEAERLAEERKQAKEQAKVDAQLKRTYSSPEDVEAAKLRTLGDLRNNINILNASLLSSKKQLADQEASAARLEQSGKPVPPELVKNVSTLRLEVKETNLQIQQRELDFKATSDKFDQEKARVKQILVKP